MRPVSAISIWLKNGGRIAINDFCRRRIHQHPTPSSNSKIPCECMWEVLSCDPLWCVELHYYIWRAAPAVQSLYWQVDAFAPFIRGCVVHAHHPLNAECDCHHYTAILRLALERVMKESQVAGNRNRGEIQLIKVNSLNDMGSPPLGSGLFSSFVAHSFSLPLVLLSLLLLYWVLVYWRNLL